MNNLMVKTSFPGCEQGLELRSRLLNPVNSGTLPQADKIFIGKGRFHTSHTAVVISGAL